jgi:plastocyanin
VNQGQRHGAGSAILKGRFMSLILQTITCLALALIAGCATSRLPASSQSGQVAKIMIGNTVVPSTFTAKTGDEIRWVNTATTTAHVFFADNLDGQLSCQKGFAFEGWDYLFSSEPGFFVVAKLRPKDFASVCFSLPGTYPYTVRVEKREKTEDVKITGTITIE